ncbi:MAG: hypothetical protein ACT4PJ_06895 [Gemmatimonadaceae bacterium]
MVARRRIAIATLTTLAVAAALGTSPARDASGQDAAPAGDRARPPASTPLPEGYADSTWIEMRNVHLRVDDRGLIRVERLRGQVLTGECRCPAVLDDARSFTIRVTSGVVRLTGDDLATLLNKIVFNYRGSPLKKLRARFEGSAVVLSGTLHKGVDLPFSIWATPKLEPDGRVRMHPTRTRILGINGAALMRALGLHLDDLLDLEGAKGATVDRDDILLDPMLMLPPPAIEGRLAWIGVEGDRLVQRFVDTALDTVFHNYVRPDSTAPNFVYFRGGRLRFGKLEMTDTDLQIVDADQSDPFDLYLAKYNRQLVAGHSRNLDNYGLRVEMPDYADLDAGAVASRDAGDGGTR